MTNAHHSVERLLELALERGAIQYGEFTLSSGKLSSYYFDGRLLTLDPAGAELIAGLLLPAVQAAGAEAIGGTTLGADPIVAAAALASVNLPPPVSGFIVRKESKEHGTQQQIEGPLRPGSRVAIVDDVCTTGGSLFHAIAAAEAVGCQVALTAAGAGPPRGRLRRTAPPGIPLSVPAASRRQRPHSPHPRRRGRVTPAPFLLFRPPPSFRRRPESRTPVARRPFAVADRRTIPGVAPAASPSPSGRGVG